MKKTSLFIPVIFLLFLISCDKIRLNKVPSADAGPAQTIQRPVDSVTLTGSGTDEDGHIIGYLWSEISGPGIPFIHNPGSATTKISGLSAGSYRFQLMVIDDDGATGMDTVSVTVLSSTTTTINLQPGTADGQDALVIYKEGDAVSPNLNLGQLAELNYSRWTYSSQGFGEGTIRSYIKFSGLSAIPSNAEIISAKLSLYGVSTSGFTPQGSSHYPGSPYGSAPDNPGWVKRVTADWDETNITWNNKPGITNVNQAAIPGTTSQWNYNVVDIDVIEQVKTMILSASNFGFCLTLQNEAIYRNVIFASSEATDATKRPKLVIVYRE